MKNLIVIISLASVFLLSACERSINVGCISPEGSTEEQVVDFDIFDRIEIVGDAEVFITEGPLQEVIVEAAPNIIDRLIEDSRVSDEKLFLEINGCSKINNGELVVRITMPSLRGLTVRGDGSYTTEGLFSNIENLSVDIVGDGNIDLQLGDLNFLSANILGDGSIVCTGSAVAVGINMLGDGDINFFDFHGERLDVKIKGGGACQFTATEMVDIKIEGDGKIKAFGTAEVQEIELTGDGEISNHELLTEVTNISLVGDGNVEVTASVELNVTLLGDGEVCYKGDADVNVDSLIGDGEVENCN